MTQAVSLGGLWVWSNSGCVSIDIQWNPSTPDTIGTTVSVLISGVDLYTFVCICGKTKCPDFRGVRSEGFHYIRDGTTDVTRTMHFGTPTDKQKVRKSYCLLSILHIIHV